MLFYIVQHEIKLSGGDASMQFSRLRTASEETTCSTVPAVKLFVLLKTIIIIEILTINIILLLP